MSSSGSAGGESESDEDFGEDDDEDDGDDDIAFGAHGDDFEFGSTHAARAEVAHNQFISYPHKNIPHVAHKCISTIVSCAPLQADDDDDDNGSSGKGKKGKKSAKKSVFASAEDFEDLIAEAEEEAPDSG